MVPSTRAYSKSGSPDRQAKTRANTPPFTQRRKRWKTLFHSPKAPGRSRQGTVWSRDEVVRVDLEDRSVVGPGVADGLEGGPPAQRLEVLGEVVSLDEGEHVGLQRLKAGVVEGLDGGVLDGGVLDGAVHPFRLAVGPRMARLGEPVLDAVVAADAVEDVAHPLGVGPSRHFGRSAKAM